MLTRFWNYLAGWIQVSIVGDAFQVCCPLSLSPSLTRDEVALVPDLDLEATPTYYVSC